MISGIWKIEPAAKVATKAISSMGMYDHYLDVNNIEYLEEGQDHSMTGGMRRVLDSRSPSFKLQAMRAVTDALERCPLSFYILLGSFCPSIGGQELAKACILLSLVGGCDVNSKRQVRQDNFRANLHTLILGERGIGKNEIMRFVEGLSPSSRIGLTRQLYGRPSERERATDF